MKHRAMFLVLILLPILVGGGYALTNRSMTAPIVAVLGAVMIWLGYSWYARQIDQNRAATGCEKSNAGANVHGWG